MCSLCPTWFTKTADMVRHLTEDYGGVELKFRCGKCSGLYAGFVCNRRFKTSQAIHENAAHPALRRGSSLFSRWIGGVLMGSRAGSGHQIRTRPWCGSIEIDGVRRGLGYVILLPSLCLAKQRCRYATALVCWSTNLFTLLTLKYLD